MLWLSTVFEALSFAILVDVSELAVLLLRDTSAECLDPPCCQACTLEMMRSSFLCMGLFLIYVLLKTISMLTGRMCGLKSSAGPCPQMKWKAVGTKVF